MAPHVNPTDSTSTSQTVANSVRNGVKAVAMTRPEAIALLHFSNNFANGETFGQAIDHTLDQVAADYNGVTTTVLDAAKKVATKEAEVAKKIYEASKPKDKVEVGLSITLPSLIPVKRAAIAFGNYIKTQWNSLPTLSE